MSQSVKKQVSTESSMWLGSMRKSLSALRRAIPKEHDPAVRIEEINAYRVRLVADWQEFV